MQGLHRIQGLHTWLRGRGGPNNVFLPLFSQQVNPDVKRAQVKFWRMFFSAPNWKGKKLHVDHAVTLHGRVLAKSVARDVFNTECALFANVGDDDYADVLEGWWDNPETKIAFHLFSRPISTWRRILMDEHENVINPGHSDNVCTVGELEETLPEFKALPRQGKWKILHALVAQGVAKLDITGNVSDTGIIWTKRSHVR